MESKKTKTRLQVILKSRGLTNREFANLILETTGRDFKESNLSKIITGKNTTFSIQDGIVISKALDLKIDDIVGFENVENEV